MDAGIANDLTSAADGWAPLARAGHQVFVGFGAHITLPCHGADVVALNLDPPARSGSEAAVLATEADEPASAPRRAGGVPPPTGHKGQPA